MQQRNTPSELLLPDNGKHEWVHSINAALRQPTKPHHHAVIPRRGLQTVATLHRGHILMTTKVKRNTYVSA